ncbi:MAG: DUF1616 domain-containing protein [Candidatus Altiarchaeota archaeon]|nr:DUF1616 domain-containing protein [Candidatus Altiarchaeota archaeon]
MEFQSIVIGTAALMLIVAVPGYAITLALFPRKDELDFVERLGFSFALGFVPWMVQYILAKNLGFPVTMETTLGLISLVTAAGLIGWKLRNSPKSQASGG